MREKPNPLKRARAWVQGTTPLSLMVPCTEGRLWPTAPFLTFSFTNFRLGKLCWFKYFPETNS